jgi:hypothetical protein
VWTTGVETTNIRRANRGDNTPDVKENNKVKEGRNASQKQIKRVRVYIYRSGEQAQLTTSNKLTATTTKSR